jgi:peptidoglycan/xylan/chitin deacetylase (PgdA/CDA1 family)
MYHSISNDSENNIAPYFRINTTKDRFYKHMLWLKQKKYKVIDIAEGLKIIKNKISSKKRYIVLTFYYGYYDFYTDAWPILREFEYTATVFLPTGFIGKRCKRKSFNNKYCMNWDEVKILSKNGIDFGSHSINHSIFFFSSLYNFE